MPNWFFIALLSPFLWGIVNHADKYLLSRYLMHTGVGAILVFSCLFSFILLPFIASFTDACITSIDFYPAIGLMGIGALNAFGFYFYLITIEQEEASVVIPLLQLGPVFSYALGYCILGEVLSPTQIVASLVILIGVVILSVDIDLENKIRIKKALLLTMCLSALLFALSDTVFKYITLEGSFWTSTFWQYGGVTLVGISCVVFIPKYRRQFYTMLRANKKGVLSINIGSEALYLLGNLANNFAILLAPVALVATVCSSQPLFVFITGTLLTIFFPHIATEKISRWHLIQKMVAILIIVAGSWWLYSLESG